MMFARYIPSIIVIGVALAAYRLFGVGELFQELIKPKHLQPSYDYIIGTIRFTINSLLYVKKTAFTTNLVTARSE